MSKKIFHTRCRLYYWLRITNKYGIRYQLLKTQIFHLLSFSKCWGRKRKNRGKEFVSRERAEAESEQLGICKLIQWIERIVIKCSIGLLWPVFQKLEDYIARKIALLKRRLAKNQSAWIKHLPLLLKL